MKRLIIGFAVFSLLFLPLAAQSDGGNIKCTLKGVVIDLPQSNQHLILGKLGEDSHISIPIHNGAFEYTFHCHHEELYFLHTLVGSNWQSVSFISEQGVINFTIHAGQASKDVVEGGLLNKEYQNYKIEENNKLQPLHNVRNARFEQLRREGKYQSPEAQLLIDQLNVTKNKRRRTDLNDQLLVLSKTELNVSTAVKALNDSINGVMHQWRLQYAMEHPNIVGYSILLSESWYIINNQIDISQFENVFQTVFAPKYLDHPYTAKMNDIIRISSLKMGGSFIDFTSADFTRKPDSALIVYYLTTITKTDGFRHNGNIPLLNQTAKYIFSVFSQYADTVYYQPFQWHGKTYMNVVCRLGNANNKPLVVVGAHYDTVDTEGADDNTSGVVGLLELVRILSKEKLNYPIEIVAYTLEEQTMIGSFIHAKSLHDTGIPVYGMVGFEMIGYFDDSPNSQSYPVKAMKLIHGNKGNFIVLARKTKAERFVKNFSTGFKKMATIDTKIFKASSRNIKIISTSDHRSYWRYGYDALMITNTAHYRNPHYHKRSDTMETLDIPKMMQVIDATALAIINLK